MIKYIKLCHFLPRVVTAAYGNRLIINLNHLN